MSGSLPILDYHHSEALRSRYFSSGLWTFVAAYALAGTCVYTVADVFLRQWNSYIGPEISLAFDATGAFVAAFFAATILGLTSAALQRGMGSAIRWRGRFAYIVAGAFCAVATFLPDIIDTRLTGILDPSTGGFKTTGLGELIGWICFVCSPVIASVIFVRFSLRGHSVR